MIIAKTGQVQNWVRSQTVRRTEPPLRWRLRLARRQLGDPWVRPRPPGVRPHVGTTTPRHPRARLTPTCDRAARVATAAAAAGRTRSWDPRASSSGSGARSARSPRR